MKIRTPRRGVLLLTGLVLLAAIAIVLGSLTWQSVTQRRLLAQRERQLQAEWLARGGIERAAALTSAGKKPTDETWKPLATAEVRLQVTEKDGTYRVRSEAIYPVDEPNPVSRLHEARIPGATKM